MGLFSLLIYEISGSTGDILICCLLGICLFSVADYHKYKTGFAQIKDKIRKDLNFRIAVFFVKPVSGHQVKPPGHAAGEFRDSGFIGRRPSGVRHEVCYSGFSWLCGFPEAGEDDFGLSGVSLCRI
jgi:hypothetical protein